MGFYGGDLAQGRKELEWEYKEEEKSLEAGRLNYEKL